MSAREVCFDGRMMRWMLHKDLIGAQQFASVRDKAEGADDLMHSPYRMSASRTRAI